MSASPIRDSAGKLAITPGVWRHVHTLSYSQGVYSDNGKAPLESIKFEGLYLDNLADGHLFAEAGTVTNQTGHTPAELAALVRELRGALATYRKHDPYFMDDNLLAKSEGV
jgi:hypothetical protein